MIRQYIYALDIAERREEVSQLFQVFILICNARNEDVADPYRFVNLAEIAGTIEYVLIAMKRQLCAFNYKDELYALDGVLYASSQENSVLCNPKELLLPSLSHNRLCLKSSRKPGFQ